MVGDVDDVAGSGELWSVIVLVSNSDSKIDSSGSGLSNTAVLSHQCEVVDVSLLPVQGYRGGNQACVTVH